MYNDIFNKPRSFHEGYNMNPISPKKWTLAIFSVIALVYGAWQIWWWFGTNYQGWRGAFVSWANQQNYRDPKLAWDLPMVEWTLLFAGIALLVLWSIFHKSIIAPFIGWCMKRGIAGPLFALCAGALLCGGLAFAGFLAHYFAVQAINDPAVSREALWAWISAPAFASRLELSKFLLYLFVVFLPRTLLLLLGLSAAVSAVFQTVSYKSSR